MRQIRSLAFMLVFYPATFVFVLVAFAAIPLGPAKVRAVCEAWGRFFTWCARILIGIRTRIEGEVPRGCVLVAGKHQAMYETIEIVTLLDSPAVVMKRELAVVPLALDSGRLWPRSWIKSPGIVTYRFGEPIPPGLPRREIEARVHEAINALEG